IAVVGKASGVKQAVRMAAELKPDVVLMDVKLADGSGIDATEQIKVACPDTQVLMLTVNDDQDTVLKAVQAGAIGYVLKDIPPENLIRAIRSVHSDRTMINPVDRKSTRLNSSHVAISYAVFCLKKKKNT